MLTAGSKALYVVTVFEFLEKPVMIKIRKFQAKKLDVSKIVQERCLGTTVP